MLFKLQVRMKVSKRRKYLKKASKPYTQKDVEKALTEVNNGTRTMTLRKAAVAFKVPKSTLHSKCTFATPIECRPGRPTYLTHEEEQVLETYIFYCADRGFPMSKPQLLPTVKKIVVDQGRETPFTDDTPGRHWYEGFLRRHPNISTRMSQNLTVPRASVDKETLQSWFEQIGNYMESAHLQNVKPESIFNMDESAFFLVPKGDKVLARRGCKAVYKVVAGDDKESLTVLFTVSAAGIMLPPLILYWYERIPLKIAQSTPTDWLIGTTERGWMTAEAFYNYIKDGFYPWLLKNKIEFPVILFVDGHVSHVTLQLSLFCTEKRIELFGFVPHATHIQQPLDVAVFSPLKKAYKVTHNLFREQNDFRRLTREDFARLLETTLKSMKNLSETIKNGFRNVVYHLLTHLL